MKGTGYLQPEFKQSCFACQVDITRESLGLAKFLQNLTLESEPKKDHFILTAMLAWVILSESKKVSYWTAHLWMVILQRRGTLRTQLQEIDITRASQIKKMALLRFSLRFKKSDPQVRGECYCVVDRSWRRHTNANSFPERSGYLKCTKSWMARWRMSIIYCLTHWRGCDCECCFVWFSRL